MTWYCASCETTLTYTGQRDFVMQECPRCGKWMERKTATTAEGAA